MNFYQIPFLKFKVLTTIMCNTKVYQLLDIHLKLNELQRRVLLCNLPVLDIHLQFKVVTTYMLESIEIQ